MKDVAGSGKAPYSLVCGDLAKRHSKMFSITLVLTLIALVAFAAFLVSDIMSFESNASYEKSFSVFSFMNSKENGIAIKDLRDDALDLANQGKDQEPARVLENAAASNLSREDIGTPLSSLNGSEAAKGSPAGNDNAGKRPDPTAKANSSLNNASTLTGQTAGTAVAIIKPSGSDSHRSDKKKKHSSSKKDIQVNRNAASLPSTAAENQSQLNQSQNHTNLSTNMSLAQPDSHVDLSSMDLSSQSQSSINMSNNLSLNLSASEPKMNATEIPSYNSRPEDTDISFGKPSADSSANSFVDSVVDSVANSSANPDALSQLDTNSTVISDPNAFDADLTPVADFPAKLSVSELSSADSETSKVELPIQELNRENSIPPDDDEDLGHDSSDEGISDGLVDFNSDIDTNDVEVFADPVETDDGASPSNYVPSEPQYPEHSMTADREWPTNGQEEPAPFVSSQEDRSVKGDLDFAEPTSKVVPADKSPSKWKGAENKRLSSRDKRDKTEKRQKRPTPPARPARTRPARPARDNSRD